tara:strand:- start:367 stop:522 length:156 start_codon:yes stop_codon:yes gene_type:complete
MATKSVSSPKGFHWMKKGKEFKLMKNPSVGFKPHKGATLKAAFTIQKVHKG